MKKILPIMIILTLVVAGVVYSQKSNTIISLPETISQAFNPTTEIYLDPTIEETLSTQIRSSLEPNNFELTENLAAKKQIAFGTEGTVLHTRYYAVVTGFSNLSDSLTTEEVAKLLNEGTLPSSYPVTLGITADKADLQRLLPNVLISYAANQEALLQTLNSKTLAFIPFENIHPKMKVLHIGTSNILSPSQDLAEWPLKRTVVLTGENTEKAVEHLQGKLTTSNRAMDRVGTIVFTGVTAVSRGVEYAIAEQNDPVFPARGVMDVLSKADITHIDNENPFFDSCEPAKEGIILCGKTASIASLKAVGADIIDLTGNHQNDYGPDKNLESIGHLEAAGFKYFGGGKNKEDAEKVLLHEVKGTTFGFVGYNYFDSLNGPGYVSLAKEDYPGANYFSLEKLEQDVKKAKEQADIVVVDYQFIETYHYKPLDVQREIFRKSIEFGADIVIGVQSHQPQEIEFHQDGVIFYGLGNFFFDQMWSHPTRQGLIPRLSFHDGKVISIELLTTLLHDYAQPRFTDGEERTALLKAILPTETKR